MSLKIHQFEVEDPSHFLLRKRISGDSIQLEQRLEKHHFLKLSTATVFSMKKQVSMLLPDAIG